MEQKNIGKSKEDYLKAILILRKKHGACRSVDVSNYMGVSKSSASMAIKKLEEVGLVIRDDWRIVLTESGEELAEKLCEKDTFFTKWFKEIGVSNETAEVDACMVEHAISEETFSKIKAYISANMA